MARPSRLCAPCCPSRPVLPLSISMAWQHPPGNACVRPCVRAPHRRRRPTCFKWQVRTELLVQMASLVHLRLLVRVSADEQFDTIRLRCDAPYETVERVAKLIGFDLREYEKEA